MFARIFTAGWRRLRALSRVGVVLGRGPQLVLVVGCLVIAVLYGINDDMGGDPSSPRGDGRYRPVLARGDGHMMFLMARSVVFDHDLVFDNDLARFGDPWRQKKTAAGRKGIPHPIGPVLVWTPLLAAAHGGALIANQFGADIEEHGYTIWHQRIVFASSVVFACLSVLLAVWLFRRRVGGTWAPTWAAVAVLLGSSLTYYATYMPSYGHAMDAAAVAGFLAAWGLTLGDWRWRRIILLGALLGLAGLVRSQELGLGVVVAVEVFAAVVAPSPAGRSGWRWRIGLLARGAAVALIALTVFVPQFVAWSIVYGNPFALPQGVNFTRPEYPMITELLFAARNGWFSTTPLAYAGVLGLVALAVRGPRIGSCARVLALGLLLAVVVQIYLNSIIYDWWAGASHGARRLCSMTLPIVIGLASWLHILGRAVAGWRVPRALWHAVALFVLGWFVTWNLGWVLRFHSGRPAERGVGPICCRGVPRPLAWLADPIYRAIGNPFALPGSAIFGWRYHLPLRRWDQVIGDYPLVPPIDYTRETMHGLTAEWNLGGTNIAPYLVSGVGPSVERSRPAMRWTIAPRATILIPVLIPEPLRLTLQVTSERADLTAVVRWNGRQTVRTQLPIGTSSLSWDIAGDVGLQELTIETANSGTKVPMGSIGLGPLKFTGL